MATQDPLQVPTHWWPSGPKAKGAWEGTFSVRRHSLWQTVVLLPPSKWFWTWLRRLKIFGRMAGHAAHQHSLPLDGFLEGSEQPLLVAIISVRGVCNPPRHIIWPFDPMNALKCYHIHPHPLDQAWPSSGMLKTSQNHLRLADGPVCQFKPFPVL